MARMVWKQSLAVFVLLMCANCDEGPEFEVFANIDLEYDGATLEYDGEQLQGWPNGVHWLNTVFPSFESGRSNGLKVVVHDPNGGSTELRIVLGTCLEGCPTPCSDYIGSVVKEVLSVTIRPDATVSASGTTCWDAEGRGFGHVN